MCGDSHLPAAPESNDLIAIIHPVPSSSLPLPTESSPPLTRTSSHSSTCSSTRSSSASAIQGRLRLWNNLTDGNTVSNFEFSPESGHAYGILCARIHQYGSPLQFSTTNPVLYEFFIGGNQCCEGVRLDLGVGGEGVVGRTVSIVDGDARVLGEGIIGRI